MQYPTDSNTATLSSYSCLDPYFCESGSFNPSSGPSVFFCLSCPAGKNSPAGSKDCPDWCQVDSQRCASDMDGFFNAVSSLGSNTGNNIISNGDTVELATGIYECNESGSNCASSYVMLDLDDLSGSIECTSDSADCVIDGQSSRGVIKVHGTGSNSLTIRALTFLNGRAGRGGGAFIEDAAAVNVVLCFFSNCRATESNYGGGAIILSGTSTAVNLYATQFTGNTAATGNGHDTYNHKDQATITIHDTCPSPYSSNTPTQGTPLHTFGTVNGDVFSFTGCAFYLCSPGQGNPSLGTTSDSCEICSKGEAERGAKDGMSVSTTVYCLAL